MLVKYPAKSFKYLFLLIIASFGLNGIAQSKLDKDYSSSDIENLINFNPEQSLDFAQLLLSDPNIKNKDKAKLIFLIFKAYKAKGNYSSALSFLYEEKKYENYLSEEDKIHIEFEKLNLLRSLSWDEQSKAILEKLEHHVEDVSDVALRSYLQTAILIEKAKNLSPEGKIKEAIRILENLEKTSKNIFASHPDLKVNYNFWLGVFYLKNAELDKAKKNFELVIANLNNQKNVNLYLKSLALYELAEVSFHRNEYQKTIPLLNEALLNAKNLGNVFLQETILKLQYDVYLALNDTENYKRAYVNSMGAQTQSDSLIQEAMDTSFNLISNEHSELNIKKENDYFTILYLLISLNILVFLFYHFSKRKNLEEYKNLKEIIRYVEITRNTIFSVLPVKNPKPKNVISKEIEDEILKKLKRFEKSNRFVNKDISLSILAVKFDTNVKYLSDVINSNYNLNFNAYINTLRINYIVEKLKTEPEFKNYKISYLADYCGFAAHSSFATIFKSVTGISPIKFIELLKKEKENTLLNDIQQSK